MIRVVDLSYAYPGPGKALAGIDFSLERGRTLGLSGANGSGKSTLLALLAGLYTPTSGRIRISSLTSPGQEKAIRSVSALVMQETELQIIGSTVGEDLSLAQGGNGNGLDPEARETAARYGLLELLERPVQELSFGQKKRLCLATMLHRRPELLLLDEPFAGLDYPGAREMRASLAANRDRGLTQVIAAHDLEPLADLVDEWLVLERGRQVLFGPGREVFGRVREFGVRPPSSWLGGRGLIPWE